MQLRSGRSIVSKPLDVNPAATFPPVPVYKPTPIEMISSYKPISPSEPIVRYIFTFLDKYNRLSRENDTNYMQLIANVPTDHLRDHRIKNIETLWIIENCRIRTEMVSIMNDNFDIISAVLPPFMLYGMVTDARFIYDKFNTYKDEFPILAVNYSIEYSQIDVERTIKTLLHEINIFDNKFTEFIVTSYAMSRLYTF